MCMAKPLLSKYYRNHLFYTIVVLYITIIYITYLTFLNYLLNLIFNTITWFFMFDNNYKLLFFLRILKFDLISNVWSLTEIVQHDIFRAVEKWWLITKARADPFSTNRTQVNRPVATQFSARDETPHELCVSVVHRVINIYNFMVQT